MPSLKIKRFIKASVMPALPGIILYLLMRRPNGSPEVAHERVKSRMDRWKLRTNRVMSRTDRRKSRTNSRKQPTNQRRSDSNAQSIARNTAVYRQQDNRNGQRLKSERK